MKRIVLTALAIGAVLPLALLKNMAALSKTSFISLLSVVFILGVVILNAVAGTAADTKLPKRPVRGSAHGAVRTHTRTARNSRR